VIIYCNGQYVHEDEARISPFDHGFLYGMGLFETVRIYDGHPFLLDDHLVRLQNGLKELGIETNVRKAEICSILHELLVLNQIRNARIRINYSAGIDKVGMPVGRYLKPNLMIFISSISDASDHIEEKNAVILKLARNVPETGRRLKSHHFGNNIAAKMEIQQTNPGAEGIFLTREGYVAEGITSNVFWVEDDIIYTPSEKTGILLGITRQWIITLAKEIGYEVQEGCFQLENITRADELFLTNSIQEIVAVNELIGTATFKGVNGKVTNALYAQYKQYRTSLWTYQNLL